MPTVLFVGDDASSTQIAESLLRRRVGDAVTICTAGAHVPDPGGREDQMLVMMGLNPAHEDRISVHALNTSDWVIILGTTLDVARVPGRRYEEWDLATDDLQELVEELAVQVTRTIEDPGGVEREARTKLRVKARRLRRRRLDAASGKLGRIATSAWRSRRRGLG